VYRLLQGLETNVYGIKFEPGATQFAKGFSDIKFYESLDAVDRQFDLIYAPFLLHRLSKDSAANVISDLYKKLELSGSLIFYQLSSRHKLRLFMEWCLDWVLHYHDDQILEKVAQQLNVLFKFDKEGDWLKLELKKLP
jgi:hypothetical protein